MKRQHSIAAALIVAAVICGPRAFAGDATVEVTHKGPFAIATVVATDSVSYRVAFLRLIAEGYAVTDERMTDEKRPRFTATFIKMED